MQKILLELIVAGYALSGVVSAIAYWPTIKDLYLGKPSANIASYSLWSATSGMTFLYSLFVLPDFFFRFVSGVAFSACTAILVMALKLKCDNRRRQELDPEQVQNEA